MSDITFHVTVDDARLRELMRPGAIEALAGPTVKEFAFQIEGQAKMNAPVLTGFLRNSLQASQVNPGMWKVEDGAEYGIFQELGTRYMPGKFFLTKACEALADKFFDAIVRVIR